MHARDASGRQVSLLNDDFGSSPSGYLVKQKLQLSAAYQSTAQLSPLPYPCGISSSPNTPELVRSNSYDSHTSVEPVSPQTPASYDYISRPYAPAIAATGPLSSPYEDYMDAIPAESAVPGFAKRPALRVDARAASYDSDDMMIDVSSTGVPATGGGGGSSNGSATSPGTERPGKRYPCRYRDSHGCEKTFTTSGHASRHSKIHTAEKAVQCTHEGCGKKFTRADNMKQHLETHYKDKSASFSSSRHSHHSSSSSSSTRPSLTADRRTNSSALKPTSSNCSRPKAAARSMSAIVRSSSPQSAAAAAPPPPLQQPQPASIMAIQSSDRGAWNMRGGDMPLLHRPGVVARTPSSGLDALAFVIACQESA